MQFQNGDGEAAVETIDEAIALAPGIPYFEEQRRRFTGERARNDRPAPPEGPLFGPAPERGPEIPIPTTDSSGTRGRDLTQQRSPSERGASVEAAARHLPPRERVVDTPL